MNCHRKILIAFAALLLWASNAHTVDFLKGIDLYNRARYDSLIYDFAPAFIKEHPHEEGIARYFLAESYYNKALQTSDRSEAIRFLQRARQEFSRSRQSSDLPSRFGEFFEFAGYKIGWCSFRLAELGVQPLQNLQRAYEEFLDSSAAAPDSVQIFAAFMAAESRLRRQSIRTSELLEQPVDEQQSQAVLDTYRTISEMYEKMLARLATASGSANIAEMEGLIRMKRAIVDYRLGDFSLKLSAHKQNFAIATGSATNTARDYFERIEFPDSGTSDLKQVSNYFGMMKFLQLYFIRQSDQNENQFLENWSQIRDRELESELWFRRANMYHADPDIDSPEFTRLAADAYTTAAQIGESAYWLGYLQMILGDVEQSRKHLVQYLATAEDSAETDVRQRILHEDAQYKIDLLDFESFYFASNQNKLRQLSARLNRFAPLNPMVRDRSEQLRLLVSCALTSNTAQIWSDALSGSDDQKLEMALKTIRFILPRAALNIGTVRAKYIALLHRLFKLTETRRSDATRFFLGIVQSLEAEIEPTPDAKIALFRKAARTLNTVDPGFHAKVESDYVRARCLFFAEEFDLAEQIFSELVNEHNHLRSLFYLAEIFRLTERGQAAKACYDAIITKLQNTQSGFVGFWKSNASAGLASADDTGDLNVLDGLDLQAVQFQPAVNPDLVAYEHLAEERILLQQYAGESIDWLIKFGLPHRALYPSQNRLRHANLIYPLHFGDLGAVLDEVRHPVTSTLNVIVLKPDTGTAPEVELDAQTLAFSDGVYRLQKVELNSVHTLHVRHPDSYEFSRRYHFTVPGEDTLVVPLNEKLNYLHTGRTAQLRKDEEYVFPRRWDANFILNPIPDIDLNSQLVIDFETRAELRDYAYDPIGERILAVNASENSIWIYGVEPPVKRGVLQLDATTSLNNPEGIAVDADGRIYISDWGEHRILVFDQSGALLSEIGSFGSNEPEGSGEQAKFTFPTRVAVVADSAGIEYQGQTYHRSTTLYVADHYGIHLCDLDGTYLDTIVPSRPEFSHGSFYGFEVEGYGVGSKLGLVSREKEALGRVYEFLAR